MSFPGESACRLVGRLSGGLTIVLEVTA